MGNTHTKEERGSSHQTSANEPGSSSLLESGRHGQSPAARRPSRPDLALGIALTSSSSSRQQDVPFERRETKQEREARKLEKERVARVKERERSMKEEHVDGGYLVTMGIYTASEDFNKPVVRQLQIERKIAPFWRGLDDFKDTWAEHQIIAAARGLEIPPADQVPEHLVPQPRPHESPEASSSNLNNLTVPMGARTLSASSDRTASYPGSTLPSPPSPATPKTTSPLKQPKKVLAAALNLSRNSSQAEITLREINLPHDPFVNGQALEVFLYKEGEECPLCLMYYPPYLNRTRCCCQLICSECFVQIKRPDPHFPEHHVDGTITEETQPNPEERNERLVMEPAKCPYCTQSDFGVTYEHPPFRRGLAYAFPPSNLGTMSTAMSSTSSVNSSFSPTAAGPARPSRKRAQSLSANAPGVVTADRLRPDWAGKLATARAHQRRRAAAADALHHAAFVMGNQDSRTFFGRSSRFSRRATGSYRGAESPGSSTNAHEGADETPPGHDPGSPSPAARTGPYRERIDAAHLENLMMAEAIRLSLADEEERRKKADKEARKEAKKREKEERKAAKKKGEVYGSGSASASSLSLGLGRRRNNSGTGNLRVEASVAAATVSAAQGSEPGSPTYDKGKGVERGFSDEASSTNAGSSSALPIPTPQMPRGMSHLRQMSNASSISSDGLDSMPGSYTGKGRSAEDPHGSALSLGGQSDQGESASSEPLFNFRSLAEVVGVSIDGEGGQSDRSSQEHQLKVEDHGEGHGEHIEHAVDSPTKAAESRSNDGLQIATIENTTHTQAGHEARGSPPDVVVTPDTPAPVDGDDDDSKRLGHFDTAERTQEVTQ
ncbi:hypothetical protein HD806DRAFT_209121 [Xylariaceae sp. AK1471]|nr:hypothetical protein HD806DRAFT_209121 [Xylariaceae sp. AK1471]